MPTIPKASPDLPGRLVPPGRGADGGAIGRLVESGTRFRVDYLKPSGAIGFCHPDWVVVQTTDGGEQNWIIETKGRVWEDTEVKDAAMRDWCAHITERTGQRWAYLRVNQADFDRRRLSRLSDLARRDDAGLFGPDASTRGQGK